MKAPLTVERLRELLHYDRLTGIFTWRVRRKGVTQGAEAGSPSKGYIRITIDGVRHLAHRLAWLYVTGEWPINLLDHRDGDRANNRFVNLRQADRHLNQQNQRRAMNTNKLGLLGVCLPSGRTKYRAAIKIGGKFKYLGAFATPEEAQATYLAAKRQLHPGCTL